ncbi:MAG: calcium/sodium antiporter [Desulfobulbaceae bacterium]|nr:calcium/sodium antiporter [Desulfobulbaceae bacterium]
MTLFTGISPIILSSLSIIVGLIMLVGGGEVLISGATKLALRLGMTPLLIGLTVVAFGTSVPELFVSLTASIHGYPDIMIGNVVGSNIANIGLILGCCALFAPLHLTFRAVRIELLLVILGSIFLIVAAAFGYFPRIMGIFFVATLISYTYFACRNGLNDNDISNDGTMEPPPNAMFCSLLILAGLLLLSVGSNIFIKGAADAARHFGVSELIIGLTLAAVGTSLPELASSLAALRRSETSLLIGNVIGSNMFNLFMVLGLTSTIKPFSLSGDLLQRDLPVMLFFTAVLVPILGRHHGTRRIHGILFIGGYFLYCLSLL